MSDEADREPPGEGQGNVEPKGAEYYFRPIVDDTALRPIVLAVALALMTVLGWGLLAAVRDRDPAAVMSILLLGLISCESIIRNFRSEGHLGVISWSIIVLWTGSCLAAGLAHYAGLL